MGPAVVTPDAGPIRAPVLSGALANRIQRLALTPLDATPTVGKVQ
jgi:hypothetical protein